MTNKKLFYALIVAVMIILLGFGFLLLLNPVDKNTVEVSVSILPINQTMEYSNKKQNIKNNTTIKMEPGEYEVKFYADGFKESSKRVVIKPSDKNNKIISGLTPVTNDAFEVLRKNKDDMVGESIAGKEITDAGKIIADEYPITKILPIYTRYYIISIGRSNLYPEDSLKIAIYIDADKPEYRQEALQQIRKQGYDPTDYEIIFGKARP